MNFLKSKRWITLRNQHLKRESCCALCGSEDGLTVHHILYRRFYSKHKLDAWNLVTLCRSCHWKVHKSSWSFKLARWLARHRPRDYRRVMECI